MIKFTDKMRFRLAHHIASFGMWIYSLHRLVEPYPNKIENNGDTINVNAEQLAKYRKRREDAGWD